VQESPWRLEFAKKSYKGLGPLNHSRERRKLKSLCRSYAPENDRRVDFEPEVLEEEIERSEFSEENSWNSEDCRIQESCGEVKCWKDPPSKGRI
jgi:hypothetical protein